jgi:hypothetical protein
MSDTKTLNLTHLHGGWATFTYEDPKTYRRTEYLIQRQEWEANDRPVTITLSVVIH